MPHNPSFRSRPTSLSVSILSAESAVSVAFLSASPSSAAYQVANAAQYIPMVIPAPVTFIRAWVIVGTANGNFDIGIYNADSLQKVYSTGSTAASGSSVVQQVTCNVTIGPGRYYWAFAADSATATYGALTRNNVMLRFGGITSENSAFPLPVTATPVAMNASFTRAHIFGFSQVVL